MHFLFFVLLIALTLVRTANAEAAEAASDALAPQAHDAADYVSMGEIRGETADSRQIALDDASELAGDACNGAIQIVGSSTSEVEEGFVAEVWYLCTPED